MTKNFWQRNKLKLKLNFLLLLLPVYFFYSSMYPSYSPSWQAKQIGEFEVKPLPSDLEPPYLHHGSYAKDFMILFRQGEVRNIRQAYLNIGPEALPLTVMQKSDEGLLHGSPTAQSAHAISPDKLNADDKLWLTIEDWQLQQQVIAWDLPSSLLGDGVF